MLTSVKGSNQAPTRNLHMVMSEILLTILAAAPAKRRRRRRQGLHTLDSHVYHFSYILLFRTKSVPQKDWGIHSLVISCWLQIQLTLLFRDQKRNTGEKLEGLPHCSVHTDAFSTQIFLSTNYCPLPSVREIMRPLTTCWVFTTHTEIKRTIIVSFKLVDISSACVANWLPNFRVLLKQISQ